MASRNIEVSSTKDGKIVLTIDPSVDLGPSKSGKTNLVASSGGFTVQQGEVRINLTAIK